MVEEKTEMAMTESEKDQRIAELEARLKRVENQLNPPPAPPRPARIEMFSGSAEAAINRASIPEDDLRRMAKAVPTDLVQAIVNDGRRR
jgi:hypothetical protein